MKRTWETEFDYDGPDMAWIVKQLSDAGFTDESWGNDICPKFTDDIGKGFTVWVDYLNPNLRELNNEFRFTLMDHDETLFESDSIVKVIEFYNNLDCHIVSDERRSNGNQAN